MNAVLSTKLLHIFNPPTRRIASHFLKYLHCAPEPVRDKPFGLGLLAPKLEPGVRVTTASPANDAPRLSTFRIPPFAT
jgi:hypothetical protein